MDRREEMKHRVYLDYAATTPVDERVWKAMAVYQDQRFGNPSSGHQFGREARSGIERAREQVAQALDVDEAEEIIFTSGGTEADNLAVLGYCLAHREKGSHILVSSIEHHAVLEAAEELVHYGFQVEKIPVNSEGLVEIEEVKKRIRKETILIAVMQVNNEVGTVQPVEAIGALAKEAGVAFHTDAVQSFGVLPVSVRKVGCDLLSISSHKIYGPKGAGALFCRKGVSLKPLLLGGGQERGLRSGTENVSAIIGFGLACLLANEEREKRRDHLLHLRDFLIEEIEKRIPIARLNGSRIFRHPGNVHFLFPSLDGQALISALDVEGFAVSMGSACISGAPEPSHVLLAMGIPPAFALSAMRITLGVPTTQEQVVQFLDALELCVNRLTPHISTART